MLKIEIEKKKIKRPKSSKANLLNSWFGSWGQDYLIKNKLKKSQSQLPNCLNVEGWNWKKNN